MELLDNLKKKQDEEFDNMLKGYLALTDGEHMICKPRKKIKSFIDQVRSETAEEVARSMVGDSRLSAAEGVEEHVIMNYGYNERIAEEQAELDNILNSLK